MYNKMNERIKQLALQAGADVWGDQIVSSQYFDIDQFAQLILRECIDVVGKATASPNGYQALMKHFGVEE
jgi:hypothetical protein